ncbi:PREDICTED: uncharacterized protein LOC109584050 [Amphimedon queenslandica]|uniref:Uncharacterized protein n=1 Tax=Amphimedon queenslandica TaxID=400682 RepID=A0AAN0JDR8_AMPQE|nr:PREDICTED: uncharacterized protein LOC109584050 [Amphimedon queenslandica]|eukprot:XP_019855170.1 PREDICTED: uncharacterized protein LOC109584050 [Amphimedon queenslandica]
MEAEENDVTDVRNESSHTVFQLQKMKSVPKDMVPGMDCLEHCSVKSDISCTMNRLIYDENPIPSTATTESPPKSFDLPDHESQTSDIEEAAELHEDVLVVPKGPSSSKEKALDFLYMLDLVKTRSVPVFMCTATLVGLSTQEKSALFQDFIKTAVRFRDSKSGLACQYHARLQKRCSKKGLSSFNFNILGKSPFNDFMWLLGTKRSSISLCFLCCLIQSLKLRDIPIKFLHIAENKADFNEEELKQNKHGEWLFYEVT